ncbi:Spy/CpxP family protein refolding chaperone [Acidisphaera sp. L21]|uniref:Spy/CpxP family protein refolding chaperone n=1 Tax=Acidisphaera sp. L21 TaxID=1641851 RepID=UPI00131C8DE1|nr:Spy/CpxP family protein refolding chaperone [Acidisphaera sp. L21]
MTSSLLRTSIAAVALSFGLCGAAFAQAPAATPAVAATPAPAPAPVPAPNPAVEQRINALQSQLGITPAQTPLWSAFAQAMRENAATTEQLFQQRASAAVTMSAVDNMHSYATLAKTYADDTASLSTAFDSLYASLSPTQKQAADTLFRQQATAKKR